MTEQSRTLIALYQVRKIKKQKEAFRQWLCGELEAAGYAPNVERSGSGANVVAGDPETAKVLFTAHYDTQPVLPLPNFITPRNLGWYLLYQMVLLVIMFAVCALFITVAYLVCILLSLSDAARLALGFLAFYAGLLFSLWWMFFGKANKHTLNDNTSGVLTLLETALALPENQRDRVCFVFFDNEEKGMLGSNAFASRHKTVKKNGLVVNFDCVSDGNYLQFFPGKGLKKDEKALEALERAFQSRGDKSVEIVRGFGFYPSDNASFQRAVGVCALRKNRAFGYYMSRIHTGRDTVLEEENILLLRDGALAYVRALSAEPVTIA